MSESNVINQNQKLRKALDKEKNLLKEQMELPLDSNLLKYRKSKHNLEHLNRGVAFSKWIRKITSQFDSIDPFYK
jgi:hypothetical protein